MDQKQTENKSGKVTIVDIARESDVSPATVSLVLRDKPGVGAKTRQRVRQIAQQMGYILPGSAANNTENGSLKNIGLVMKVRPDDLPASNQFYAPVITGIETVCRQKLSNLLYANMPVDDHNRPLEFPRLIREEKIDGLLIVGMELQDEFLKHLLQKETPIVLVDGYAEKEPYDSVTTDNLRGGYEATRYLISQGHEQIAIIGSREQAYPSIRERREGYLQAMSEAKLPPLLADCELLPPVAAETAATFLKDNPQTTGFFACNDECAISVMRAVHRMGLSIPADLSIIGFDNVVLAQHVTPALTTMRVDKMGMGRLAAQLLFNRLEHPEASLVRAVTRPQLIARDSVQQRA